MMSLDFATAWEAVSDATPEATAIVQGARRMTYGEYDDAAARFAAAIAAHGLEVGSTVGLYLHNCPEYLIAHYGAFKNRSIPINVNYRYLDDELVYLVDNSESQVLVFNSSLSDCVRRVRDRLTNVKLFVEVDDGGEHLEGSIAFESLIADYEPQERQVRAHDDLYMLYTGGTTGMPKGVMYKQGDFVLRLFANFALLGLDVPTPTDREGIAPFIAAVSERGVEVSIPCCPLMHGTGMWVGVMPVHLAGGAVVLLESRHFDAHEVWRLTEQEGVTRIVVVGDPFARPMVRALEERESDGRPYVLSSVRSIVSAGAIWSAEVKDGLRARMSASLVDALGSTEGGTYALSSADSGHGAATAKFTLAPDTKVISEDRRVLKPGASEPGLLASSTNAFGYYKDPEKSARTFIEIDGRSYVITGDWATVDADGTVTLLGRGSNCINTGGEKVYPEEVEEAIKRHELVDDCLVVGMPDERFGQRVVAVVGSSAEVKPTGDELCTWLRDHLSHFKIPKAVVVLDVVRRAPNGKADYRWAQQMAEENFAH